MAKKFQNQDQMGKDFLHRNILPSWQNKNTWCRVPTYSPLHWLHFERKHSYLAQFIQEILAEPWHQFEKKGQKRPPPSLIRFAAFLPLSDESPTSSKYNRLFPSSRPSIWAQAQLSSSICSEDISRTMTPIWEKGQKRPPPSPIRFAAFLPLSDKSPASSG